MMEITKYFMGLYDINIRYDACIIYLARFGRWRVTFCREMNIFFSTFSSFSNLLTSYFHKVFETMLHF